MADSTISAPLKRKETTTSRSKDALKAVGYFLGIAAASAVFLLTTPSEAPKSPQRTDPTDLTFSYAVVDNSPGGVVDDFIAVRDQFIANGTEVHIVGECDSACTLFLSVPKVCFEDGASFGFHQPFVDEDSGITAWSDDYSKWFFSNYPKPIQDWITAHGGLKRTLTYLEGADLYKLVHNCDGHTAPSPHAKPPVPEFEQKDR